MSRIFPTIDWEPETDKRLCTACNKTLRECEIDLVQDPKAQSETWSVCPWCRTPEHLIVVCYYPGCWKENCCGTPTTSKYVFTCGKHQPGEVQYGK
jgi:hypothetical protein